MSDREEDGDDETDPSTPDSSDGSDSESGAAKLEAKYREFFGKLSKEGEPVQVDDLEQVVRRSLRREGYDADKTTAGEIFDLVREMIGSREEGDSMIVRFRVNGKDVESFKIDK